MQIRLVHTSAPTWAAELEQMGLLLRTEGAQPLPPYHFLLATLPRLGGGAAWLLNDAGRPLGAGFLFPRQRRQGGQRVFTFRYHGIAGAPPPDGERAAELLAAELHADVVFYDAGAPQYYAADGARYGPVEIGRPSAEEAAAIPGLHQAIWQSPPEFLYPADFYSVDAAAGTALVARVDGRLVGFLLGFRKFGGGALPKAWAGLVHGDDRLESQIMGVLPAFRGLRIASLLKRAQADLAWREGIQIVNWTADPLQYANAALNMGLLRAVSFEFAPDLYPFRNALNRVRASRIGLTWLVGSERVRTVSLFGQRAQVLDLAQHGEGVLSVNEGLRVVTLSAEAPIIAFELPADWTTLQDQQVGHAQAWREVTDALFAHYLGMDDGKYMLTEVAVRGDQRYLLAERVTPLLLERLARPLSLLGDS